MAYDFAVEGRVACFFPQDSHLKRVYDNPWPEYEIEASMPVACSSWNIWGNVNYYEKSGHSTCLHHHSKVDHWTFLIGGKYYFDFFNNLCCDPCDPCYDPCATSSFHPYAGIGGGAALVKFHDRSEFVKQHKEEWGGSLLLKLGVEYDICDCFFADLFADYAFNWFDFNHKHEGTETHKIQTGGLKLGLGLGYRF